MAGAKITRFGEQLRQHIKRSGYNISQVSRLAGVPRRTVANWTTGYVDHPRHAGDLLKLGYALRLNGEEVDRLLRAAGYEDRRTLAGREKALADLLAPWEAATPTPFQVVSDPPYFVGRSEALAIVQRALATPPRRCLVYGPGGVGKSTLATRAATLVREQFPDGVLWAQPNRSSLMEILQAFAAAYGHDVGNYRDLHTRSQAVRSLLAEKRALIVLDDVSSSQEAELLLPPGGECATLVTSRRHDLRLARGSPRLHLKPFAEEETCLQLFREIAGEEKVAGNEGDLREISRLLGRLPLALALVAGRLAYEPHASASDLRRRLTDHRQRLDVLEGEGESVRMSLSAGTAMLTAEELQLFAFLSVFGGHTFTADAATAIFDRPLADAVAALRRLVLLSLCQAAQDGRYRLHPLVHTFATERFAVHPQRAAAEARFLRFFSDLAAEHQQLADYERLAPERAHLKAAYLLAAEKGQPADRYALAMSLAGLFMMQGSLVEALEIVEQTAQALPARDHARQARLLTRQGVVLRWQGAHGRAVTILEQGLQHALREEDVALQAEVLAELVAAISQGPVPEASLSEHAASLHTLLPLIQAPGQRVIILNNLGVVARNGGDPKQAHDFFEKALQLVDHPRHRAALHNNLGELALLAGDLAAAEAHLATAHHLCRARGLERVRVRVQNNLGRLCFARGDYKRAHDYYDAALQVSRRWALRSLSFVIYNDMAQLALARGDPLAARSLLAAAKDLPGRERHPETEAYLAYVLERLAQADATGMLDDDLYRKGLMKVRR